MPAPLSSQRAIRLDYCRSCRGVGSIIGKTNQCESCFKQELYQNAFRRPSPRSLAFRHRLLEVLAGFGLLGICAVTAAQFFAVHARYETSGAFPYLVALGMSVLFLVGLSWRLLFGYGRN